MGSNGLATPGHGHSPGPSKTTSELTAAQTGMCRVLVAAVSVTAKDQEQPECPSLGSCTNKPGLRFNQELDTQRSLDQ